MAVPPEQTSDRELRSRHSHEPKSEWIVAHAVASPTRLLILLLSLAALWGGAFFGYEALQPGPKVGSGSLPADVAFQASKLSPATLDALATLRATATELPAPGPGDWLSEHRESGQTFQQYVTGSPTLPRGRRRFLCVAPLGPFTQPEEALLDETCAYLERYFGLEVRRLDPIPLPLDGGGDDGLPASAVRLTGRGFGPQVRSEWVLQKVLRPRLPDDAAVLIGFTARDLWPGRGWNFVFGQADLRRRVGVWSLARLGDPAGDEAERGMLLRRTLQVATHETGHMLGMRHCIAFACNMNGSNHLAESDSRPLDLCPTCTAKLVWATDVRLGERSRALAAWRAKRQL